MSNQSNRKTLVIVALLSALLLATAFGQTPSPPSSNDDYDVLKTDTNLVTLNVSVTEKTRPVTNLTVSNFKITASGSPVRPQFFEAEGPTSIVFVIDTSTSMRGEKWRNLREGLKEFLRKQSHDTDYTLVVFSDTAHLTAQSVDAAHFWKPFTDIRPDGETGLYDGIALGLDQIGCLARHRKAVVLLSDGEDNQSHNSLATIEQQVFKTHTTIYAVGILLRTKDGPSTQWRDRQLLETLARETGGLSFFPTADKIEQVLSTINAEIRLVKLRDGFFAKADAK